MANNRNDDYVVPQRDPMPIVEGQPTRQRTSGHLMHILLYVITSLIFAFFLVLGGRWLYHKTHNNNQVVVTNTSSSNTVSSNSTSQNAANTTPNNSNSSQSGNVTHPTVPATPQATTPPAAQTPPNSQTPSKQITNTGPGNMIAVFFGVSAIAAVLHYFSNSRFIGRRF